MTLLAFPSHPLPRFSPGTPKPFQLLLDFRVTVGVHVARISRGPFLQFGGFAWTLGASDMSTLLAYGGCRRDENVVALVAGTPDTLFGWLIGEFVSSLGGDGEDFLLLGLLNNKRQVLLFLGSSLLLGIPWALFATLVLALGTHLVGLVQGATVVTGAVDTHAD